MSIQPLVWNSIPCKRVYFPCSFIIVCPSWDNLTTRFAVLHLWDPLSKKSCCCFPTHYGLGLRVLITGIVEIATVWCNSAFGIINPPCCCGLSFSVLQCRQLIFKECCSRRVWLWLKSWSMMFVITWWTDIYVKQDVDCTVTSRKVMSHFNPPKFIYK